MFLSLLSERQRKQSLCKCQTHSSLTWSKSICCLKSSAEQSETGRTDINNSKNSTNGISELKQKDVFSCCAALIASKYTSCLTQRPTSQIRTEHESSENFGILHIGSHFSMQRASRSEAVVRVHLVRPKRIRSGTASTTPGCRCERDQKGQTRPLFIPAWKTCIFSTAAAVDERPLTSSWSP